MPEDQMIAMAIQVIKTLGLPTALTFFLTWGGLRVARWIKEGCAYVGQVMLVPLVSRATKFIDALDDTLDKHSKSLETVANKLDSIQTRQECDHQLLNQIHAKHNHNKNSEGPA